jgi:hypothetical protein
MRIITFFKEQNMTIRTCSHGGLSQPALKRGDLEETSNRWRKLKRRFGDGMSVRKDQQLEAI